MVFCEFCYNFFYIFVYTEEALEPQELDFIFELFFDVRAIIS